SAGGDQKNTGLCDHGGHLRKQVSRFPKLAKLQTGHQGGFREGALSPRQGSPESSTALGIDTLDLLGDGASKRSNLPDHCTCYKGH
ncbi:hypothetical protein GBF38_006020, partial [Nibea albiflora]